MAGKNIPGIHNYCDRWCERCGFASRCAIYEGEADLAPGQRDIGNREFWMKLSANFEKALALLRDAATRLGIDLDRISAVDEETRRHEQKVLSDSHEHPLAQLSWKYGEMADQWLGSRPGMIEKLEQMRDSLELDSSLLAQAKAETDTINDCVAVISWYRTFIYFKLFRALMGSQAGNQPPDPGEDDPDFQKDHDGSVKIAVIAVERSMHAWASLYALLPDQEDHFLSILSTLERLKVMALTEYPDAMKFKRPGFDD